MCLKETYWIIRDAKHEWSECFREETNLEEYSLVFEQCMFEFSSLSKLVSTEIGKSFCIHAPRILRQWKQTIRVTSLIYMKYEIKLEVVENAGEMK